MTQMNLTTKPKQTHRHRERICVCQGEGEGRGGLGIWDQQMQAVLWRMDKQGPRIGTIFNIL